MDPGGGVGRVLEGKGSMLYGWVGVIEWYNCVGVLRSGVDGCFLIICLQVMDSIIAGTMHVTRK